VPKTTAPPSRNTLSLHDALPIWERRAARLHKAEKELKRLAAVKRKKVDAQKLSSQVGRALQRLKAHKYFTYEVDAEGQLKWSRRSEEHTSEQSRFDLVCRLLLEK